MKYNQCLEEVRTGKAAGAQLGTVVLRRPVTHAEKALGGSGWIDHATGQLVNLSPADIISPDWVALKSLAPSEMRQVS